MAEGDLVVLLGGNLGDPVQELERAEEALISKVGPIRSRSRDHWTEPWGFHAETLFLNRALLIRSQQDPLALMRVCLAIEAEMGRVRPVMGSPASRIIDIDILLIAGVGLKTEELTVPHPRLHERAFALAPLADIWPQWRHPTLGRTALELLNDLAACS
jgi:2-amino-4-hydroxy-6-hydroxymethyldihydropteridine diphosphokinase